MNTKNYLHLYMQSFNLIKPTSPYKAPKGLKKGEEVIDYLSHRIDLDLLRTILPDPKGVNLRLAQKWMDNPLFVPSPSPRLALALRKAGFNLGDLWDGSSKKTAVPSVLAQLLSDMYQPILPSDRIFERGIYIVETAPRSEFKGMTIPTNALGVAGWEVLPPEYKGWTFTLNRLGYPSAWSWGRSEGIATKRKAYPVEVVQGIKDAPCRLQSVPVTKGPSLKDQRVDYLRGMLDVQAINAKYRLGGTNAFPTDPDHTRYQELPSRTWGVVLKELGVIGYTYNGRGRTVKVFPAEVIGAIASCII